MNRKIKLIWDFYGSDSIETAKHHYVHLKEFITSTSFNIHEVDYKELNINHSIAFIVVDEKDMKILRDNLRPHRGELSN